MSAMKPPAPVFLARTGYRLRRLMDAARVLPLIGGFLFLLPLLWGGGATRRAVLFIFAVWLGLIVVAAILSRPLGRVDARPEGDTGDTGGGLGGGLGGGSGGPGGPGGGDDGRGRGASAGPAGSAGGGGARP